MNKFLFWCGLTMQILQLLAIGIYALTLLNWDADLVVKVIAGGLTLIFNGFSLTLILLGIFNYGGLK